MFVALGMASWTADDGGRNPEAAVFLLPVVLEAKGHAETSTTIRRSGSVQLNLVLQHVLDAEQNVHIPADEISARLQELEENDAFEPSQFYELVGKARRRFLVSQ